ncbi:MAG: NAD(P)H-hydrate dehydratase [Syntrophotaleaceae bacterium]
MKVSTVGQMRAMDRAAMEKYGIPGELLMENAGHAAFSVLSCMVLVDGNLFVVVCGLGNNGGDGFVVARKIVSHGGRAVVFIIGDPKKISGAGALHLNLLRRLPVDIRLTDDLGALESILAGCTLVVDALLGTGLSREVTGLHRQVIEVLNRSGKPVLSIDIPSGVSGDTGNIQGCAVRADHTVTFGLPKIGNLLYPGFEMCGTLHVSHISFPVDLYRSHELLIAINDPPPLPPRPTTGHKGTFGQALFIAGAAGYLGAPCFAALSFLKAGGGYSRLAAPAGITPFIAMKGSEIVFLPQQETADGSIALANFDCLADTAAGQDMVILGPGLSLNGESQKLARRLAATIEKPLLIDGDGLTALCADLGILRQRQASTVLTPHTGEMSRLTGLAVDDIENDRIGILQQTCRDLNCHIVLKGAHTLIGFPDGRVFINLSGNSGMASAGSGDVLTGAIAAAFCLGLPFPEAICKGVFLHGLAGDLAAEAFGKDGMTAQDLLDHLPLALRLDREGLPADLAKRYAGPRLVI